MNKLWAPWRMDYIRTPKQDGCVFCIKHKSNEDKENLVLFRGKESFILMNLFPYTNGHIMISPYKHTSNTDHISSRGHKGDNDFSKSIHENSKKNYGSRRF